METKTSCQRANYILLTHCFRGSIMLSSAFQHFKKTVTSDLPYDGKNQRKHTVSTHIPASWVVMEWSGTEKYKSGRIDVLRDHAQPKVSFRYDPSRKQWVIWANMPSKSYIWRFREDKTFQMVIVDYRSKLYEPDRVDISDCFADIRRPTDDECKMMQLLYGDEHIAAIKLFLLAMKEISETLFDNHKEHQRLQKIKALKNEEKRARRKMVAEFKEKINKEMNLKWGQNDLR